MAVQEQVTRRRFLSATAAAAGGLLIPGAIGLGADAVAVPPGAGSTDHFWYRPQPPGLFVDSQRDNKAFAYADGKVLLSEDNGHTWPHSAEFPDARHIVFSCISEEREHPVQRAGQTVPQHGQPEDVPADHGQERGRQRLRPAHTPEPRQPRLVLPHHRGRQHVGRERHGDAGVGQLLQRDRRRDAGQHLLLDRQRADREDRVHLRPESLQSGRRLRRRRQDGHAAGRPRQPGDLPPHSRRGVQPGRERILRLHRRL